MENETAIEWSDEEIDATVEAYLTMLSHEQQGKPYSKTSFNEDLRRGALARRSKSSIEYRMQNISAVLEGLGMSRIQGYRPAQNVGARVRNRIEDLVRTPINPTDLEPTADRVQLERRTEKLRKVKFKAPPEGQVDVKQTTQVTQVYVRDPAIKAWVLQQAAGKCEGCNAPAPFTLDNGEPFLEVHHVKWLSEGGSDRVENSIALCPNCHRRCHLSADRIAFRNELYKTVIRLVKE